MSTATPGKRRKTKLPAVPRVENRSGTTVKSHSARKQPVEQHLFKMIEEGGPLLYHGEDEQRSFNSTYRKFRRFLAPTRPSFD